MSVPSICTGNKFRDTAEYFRGLLPIFVFEGNVKFQLESSEMKISFPPSKCTDSLNSVPSSSGGSLSPKLRTPSIYKSSSQAYEHG